MNDRKPFYDAVTRDLFYGSLPHWQQQPLDQIWDEGLRRKRNVYEIAYAMATAYHETARFKYDEEIGKGRGRKYGAEVCLIGNSYATYHGRSWPQHTWLANYAKLSIRATLEFQRPVDFVNNPDLIKDDPVLEGWAMWEGLVTGFWTGKNLADFRNADGSLDYYRARKIVNGMDKAKKIAGYAVTFEAALRKAGMG